MDSEKRQDGGGKDAAAAARAGKPVRVVLDTDIGPDCDDAGALAILNVLADRGEAEFVALGHCTSNPWGAPCADAINHYYGRTSVPVGTLKKPGFLVKKHYFSYNQPVAQKYPNRFASAPDDVPDVVGVYRRALAAAADRSLTFVAIGPLCNLAALLDSPPDDVSPLPGVELVKAKVVRAVIMGGRFTREGEVTTAPLPLVEWNFEMDPAAAVRVAEGWPTEIVFSGYEVGCDIITGKRLVDEGPAANPVREAYRLYPEAANGRNSWDLTAIHYAIRPGSPLWKVEGPGMVDVNAKGATMWKPDPSGRHYIMRIGAPLPEIAAELDGLLLCLPASASKGAGGR